jgi:GT2 family glycosyltransferase
VKVPPFSRLLTPSRASFHPALLVPGKGVDRLPDGRWHIAGDAGLFELEHQLDFSCRYAEVFLRPGGDGTIPAAALLADTADGEQLAAAFPGGRGALSRIAKMPRGVRALRLRVGRGDFRMEELAIRPLGYFAAAASLAGPILHRRLSQPHLLALTAVKLLRTLRHDGAGGVLDRLLDKDRARARAASYPEWRRRFHALTERDRDSIRELSRKLSVRISLILPVYQPPERWLERAIESVRAQLYPLWELCIADDASRAPYVRRILERAAAADTRIKVVFREANGHISAASNSALALATGEFIALLDHDDELVEEALYAIASAAQGADLIYSDEDKIAEDGTLSDPFFKPDWNPDLLLSQNYLGHLVAMRRSLVDELGGFRAGFEGSQDYDLLLRATARTDRIRHLPFPLYHWRSIAGSAARDASAKSYASDAAVCALQDHLRGRGVVEKANLPTTYRIRWPIEEPAPLVTLIIPTRDGRQILETCVESIQKKTAYANLEVLIVDNQSRSAETLEYFAAVERRGVARVLRYDAPFNFAAINNFAARHARGTVLGLLNNDLEVVDGGWLEEMVSQAIRPEIGAVGARLLYPDGTVQHGGIVLGVGGVAGHAHKYLPGDAAGYFSRAQVVHDVSAVTAACLVVRKETFEHVGGLDETLAVAFNDVDFCLRIGQRGLRNLWTPFATLIHHESKSRGQEDSPAKRARFAGETRRMVERWGNALLVDPAYNPNLTLEAEDFGLAWPPRVRKPW